MTTGQFPKRRETDEQVEARVLARLHLLDGEPLDMAAGQILAGIDRQEKAA